MLHHSEYAKLPIATVQMQHQRRRLRASFNRSASWRSLDHVYNFCVRVCNCTGVRVFRSLLGLVLAYLFSVQSLHGMRSSCILGCMQMSTCG